MSNITRYNPASVMGKATAPYVAVMEPHDHGAYVTYAAHAEKMQALQSRLDALELMQKQDFFYHLQKGLGKVAEQAIEDVVKELVRKATQTVFKVNPCHDLTSEMVDDLVKRMSSSQAFATGGLISAVEPEMVGCTVRHGQVFIGDAVIKNAVSHNPASTASEYNLTLGVKTEQKPFTLKCIKSNVDCFTQGRAYDYEIRADIFYVTSDDFVSDLKAGDHWKTEDMGAYMAVLHSTSGEPIVMFKKAYE